MHKGLDHRPQDTWMEALDLWHQTLQSQVAAIELMGATTVTCA